MDERFRARGLIKVWFNTWIYWKTSNDCNFGGFRWKILNKNTSRAKNSLTKQYQELFKLDGARLIFKDNALKEIALKAIRKKTGARGLRSILENILLKTMYDLPSQDNIEEVIVDASAAKGQSQPIIVHSKTDNKSKTNKTTAA